MTNLRSSAMFDIAALVLALAALIPPSRAVWCIACHRRGQRALFAEHCARITCAYLLEDDFELWLVNAQHVKNVPGRKTAVQDAQWLCQLLEHGLVRASFVPPKVT